MTYSLWSHDELLGESNLDYVRVDTHLRTGDLRVTPRGLILLDRLSQTHADAYYAMRRVNVTTSRGTVDPSDEETLFADLTAEEDQYEALSLELRASSGAVIPTEHIHVRDTEFLLAIDGARDEEHEVSVDAALEDAIDPDDFAATEETIAQFDEDHRPWEQPGPERDPARFQLSVSLTDQWAIR